MPVLFLERRFNAAFSVLPFIESERGLENGRV
jgi:hypothetical protein